MTFRRAEKRKAKLRLAICAPSGGGKTYSALLIAMGLVDKPKIAVIDTEHSSAELYADLTEYDVAPLDPPYSPQRYISLIKAAEEAEYNVLIIDSLSHAWTGVGGVLDMHDKATAASRSGNSYTAWRDVTPQHNALVDAMLASPMHIIVTMRTKTAYDMVEDGKGKKKPVKIGLAPVQREGMEYEFTVVLDLSVDQHVASSSKDRTRLFDGQHFVPTVETGKALREWLESGVDMPAPKPDTPTAKPNGKTLDQRFASAIKRFAKKLSMDETTTIEALEGKLQRERADWDEGDLETLIAIYKGDDQTADEAAGGAA